MIKTKYAIAIAILSLFAASNAAMAADRAGEVLALVGGCFGEIAGQRTPLKVSDPVEVGETLVTDPGAKMKVRMVDGTIVAVAAGSRLVIDAYSADAAGGKRDAHLTLVQGLVHAVVSTVSQPSRFEVDGATAVAAVRSTDWFIEVYPKRTEVGVLKGHVQVTGKTTGKAVEIADGEGTVVHEAGIPSTPRDWDAREFARDMARTKLE